MRRASRFRLLGLGCIGFLLVALIARKPPPEPAPARVDPVVTASIQREVEQTQKAAHERVTQTHVKELARLEAEQRKRHQAAAGMKLAREHLQFKAQDAWSELLATNSVAFMVLRKQAAHSVKGETPCTLCGGRGYQDYCVLCPGSRGKCAACQGTGKLSKEGYCPACEGSGKCFLCFGHGKMICPFCHNGVISLHWPLPPARLPID